MILCEKQLRMLHHYLTFLIVALHFTHSYSYDFDWIESGCDPDTYDKKTIDDNTPGTYLTNYAIGIGGVVSSIIVWNTPQYESIWMVSYFLFAGLGFALSGVCHMLADTTDSFWSANSFSAGPRISYSFVQLGYGALLYVGIRLLFTECKYKKLAWAIFNVVVIILIASGQQSVYVGISILILSGLMIIFLVKRNEPFFLLRALALGIQISGAPFLAFTGGNCDPTGYENCFEECPLPYSFNNNAVYHVMVLLGFIVLMATEKVAPISSFFKKEPQEKFKEKENYGTV